MAGGTIVAEARRLVVGVEGVFEMCLVAGEAVGRGI